MCIRDRFTARADRDGLAYEAELRLPLGEEYHFTLRTRTPSGAEYRQELGEWTVTAEALAPLELTARKGKGGTLSGGIWTWDGSIWAACVPPEGSLVTVERAVLRQYRNGAPEWEQSLPVGTAAWRPMYQISSVKPEWRQGTRCSCWWRRWTVWAGPVPAKWRGRPFQMAPPAWSGRRSHDRAQKGTPADSRGFLFAYSLGLPLSLIHI